MCNPVIFFFNFYYFFFSDLFKINFKKLFLAAPRSLWDLSSMTRNQTGSPAVEAQSPNHWTAWEFPSGF